MSIPLILHFCNLKGLQCFDHLSFQVYIWVQTGSRLKEVSDLRQSPQPFGKDVSRFIIYGVRNTRYRRDNIEKLSRQYRVFVGATPTRKLSKTFMVRQLNFRSFRFQVFNNDQTLIYLNTLSWAQPYEFPVQIGQWTKISP